MDSSGLGQQCQYRLMIRGLNWWNCRDIDALVSAMKAIITYAEACRSGDAQFSKVIANLGEARCQEALREAGSIPCLPGNQHEVPDARRSIRRVRYPASHRRQVRGRGPSYGWSTQRLACSAVRCRAGYAWGERRCAPRRRAL